MDGKWKYDYKFYQFESVEPIFVASMQGNYDVWFDIMNQYPSAKQIAAWNEFCNLSHYPLQEKTQSHFVLMNFELGSGKIPNQSYGFEMEGLFCNGQLLFVQENSGLWIRLEWEEEFNQ